MILRELTPGRSKSDPVADDFRRVDGGDAEAQNTVGLDFKNVKCLKKKKTL
jgi:hypothetical protein